MKKLILTVALSGLALCGHAQVVGFGSPSIVNTNATSGTVGTNVPAVANKTWTLALSGTNAITTFTGNSLVSLDGVHWITNGSVTLTPLATNNLTNVTVTVAPTVTSVPIYQSFQLITGPGGTNAGWASGLYGPN